MSINLIAKALLLVAVISTSSALDLSFKKVGVVKAPIAENIQDITPCQGSWQLEQVVPSYDQTHSPIEVFRCGANKSQYTACRYNTVGEKENSVKPTCTSFSVEEPIVEASMVHQRNHLMWLTEDGQLESIELTKKNALTETKKAQLYTKNTQLPSESEPTQAQFSFRHLEQAIPRIYKEPYYIIEYKTEKGAKKQQDAYIVVNTQTHRVIFWDMESTSTRPAFIAADDKRVLIARENGGAHFLVWLIDWADKAFFEPENNYGVAESVWPLPYRLQAYPNESKSTKQKEGTAATMFRPERTHAGMSPAILSGDRLCQFFLRGGQTQLACINATLDAETQNQVTVVAPQQPLQAWADAFRDCKIFQSATGLSFYRGSVPVIEKGTLFFGGVPGSKQKKGKQSKDSVFTLSIDVDAELTTSPTGKLRGQEGNIQMILTDLDEEKEKIEEKSVLDKIRSRLQKKSQPEETIEV